MKATNARKGEFVKICPDRGYGGGLFEIVEVLADEFRLKGRDRPLFNLYKAHCHIDAEAALASRGKRMVAASTRGRR
ncbi:MAG: hypothetical protein HQL42_15460 [Alphaproteobacteria bacterium]|nr:hypothetical protein [Alphaproteobacteria bacterium]